MFLLPYLITFLVLVVGTALAIRIARPRLHPLEEEKLKRETIEVELAAEGVWPIITAHMQNFERRIIQFDVTPGTSDFELRLGGGPTLYFQAGAKNRGLPKLFECHHRGTVPVEIKLKDGRVRLMAPAILGDDEA